MNCSFCDNSAINKCWNAYVCAEHTHLYATYEPIYVCEKCDNIINKRYLCYECNRIRCRSCLPKHAHSIVNTVDGLLCTDCEVFIAGHVCIYEYVPRDHVFCKRDLLKTDYGYYDSYNAISLDNNLMPIIIKDE